VELLRVASRLNATVLVLGAKRSSAVRDLVVGGTVHKIINRSSMPVVLVPAVRRGKRQSAA
jgi:nucleotide-binding universal stress UspA family protein